MVAVGLPQLPRLHLAVPWWRDCTAFTAEQSGRLAAEHLAYQPDLVADRDRAAAVLGLDPPSEAEAPARLREVAIGAGRAFLLVCAPEGEPYDPLFTGPWGLPLRHTGRRQAAASHRSGPNTS
ncbi:hypothetical protein ABZ092_02630 [Streptomyces bobili]|uniref:hypothetical protein n=1 Tax=Streptomyces bobili TaxID=67280 RepID=UPI0033B3A3BB